MYSGDVAFAVILLTGDDVGSAAEAPSLRKSPRQNVILELGYFIGRLGRTRVCALYKGDMELPSDYQGVLYIEFDVAHMEDQVGAGTRRSQVVIRVEELLSP